MNDKGPGERGSEHPVQPVHLVAAYSAPDDEISLADLWRVLMRRRWWVIITFVVFLGLGLAYALLVSPSYSYTTVLNVGSRTDDSGNTRSLSSPDTLAALASSAIIPNALLKYASQHPEDKHLYKIEVDHPKDSNVVVLQTKGPASQLSAYQTLQKQIALKLKKKSQRKLHVLQQQLSQQVLVSKAQIKELQDEGKQLQHTITQLLAGPLSVSGAGSAGSRATGGGSADQLHAMAAEIRLGDLSRRLSNIPSQVADVKTHLASVQSKLASLVPPEISVAAVQSQRPVSLGGKIIVVVAAFVGFLLGILLALFVDFVSRVNA